MLVVWAEDLGGIVTGSLEVLNTIFLMNNFRMLTPSPKILGRVRLLIQKKVITVTIVYSKRNSKSFGIRFIFCQYDKKDLPQEKYDY